MHQLTVRGLHTGQVVWHWRRHTGQFAIACGDDNSVVRVQGVDNRTASSAGRQVCRVSLAIVDCDEESVQDCALVCAQCCGSTGLRSLINLWTWREQREYVPLL